MKIHWKELDGLLVKTELDRKVGVVIGMNVDTDSHTITQYLVQPIALFSSLYKRPFMIAPTQVVSITKEVMVVKEAVSSASDEQKNGVQLAQSVDSVSFIEAQD